MEIYAEMNVLGCNPAVPLGCCKCAVCPSKEGYGLTQWGEFEEGGGMQEEGRTGAGLGREKVAPGQTRLRRGVEHGSST